MISHEQLQEHAERIRISGILGRFGLLPRLFDYLVECALAGRVPKEIEIALDVFSKTPQFNVGEDAVVRVYIYKLRRKLDEYYAGPDRSDTTRLVLPRGEYRFELQECQPTLMEAKPALDDPALNTAGESQADETIPEEASSITTDKKEAEARASVARLSYRWAPWLLGAVGLLLAVNLVVLLLRPAAPRDSATLQAVRANPLWAGMLDDNLPIYLVVGDYFIFAELDERSIEVQRLVREFTINSSTDLEQHLKNNPELAVRFMDLSMKYLPTSTAFALHSIMPILEPNNKGTRQLQVILASDLTPTMVRSAHVIYIGLLSGMGILRQMAFEGSRISIGDSFDELVDLRLQKHYFSEASMVARDAKFTDYGYFSVRTSAEGNQLVILAGAYDVALLHIAESITQITSLAELNKQAAAKQDFEALYAVQGLDQTNLDGRLLMAQKFVKRRMDSPEGNSKPPMETTIE